MLIDSGLADSPLASTVQGRVTQAGEYQVHYLTAGEGRPILLLHGGASDSRDWLGTMQALSGSHSLYAPDLIGYGGSDKSKDGYYLSDFVDFTLRFLEEVELTSPVLVGHSLGGRVCLEIALRHPEKVSKLVLVNAAAFTKLAWWGSCLGTLFHGARRIMGLPQPYPKFMQENGGYGQWVCLDRLPELVVPTMIVWSRQDPYYTVNGAYKAAGLVSGARLEIMPCRGHAPHLRLNQRFNELLISFVRDYD